MVTFLDGGKIPSLLVENKVDLFDDQNLEDLNLKDFANNNDFCGSFKISAKTGLNVSESMIFLIKTIIKRIEDMQSKGNEIPAVRESIVLEPERHTSAADKQRKNIRGCCII